MPDTAADATATNSAATVQTGATDANTTTPPRPDANTATSDDSKGFEGPFDEARARATIDRQRTEVRDLRKQLADLPKLQTKLQELEQRDMTEAQKANERATTAETRVTELMAENLRLRVEGIVTSAARDAGAVYPDLVLAKIDPADVEFYADGRPKNLEAMIADLQQRYPALFQGGRAFGNGDGGARRTAQGAPNMNDLIRERAGRA